jgi:hypothetical protein
LSLKWKKFAILSTFEDLTFKTCKEMLQSAAISTDLTAEYKLRDTSQLEVAAFTILSVCPL